MSEPAPPSPAAARSPARERVAASPARPHWQTSTTLLTRLRSFDDATAWGKLAEGLRHPLEHVARRLGLSPSDAEDVAQNTFATFARAHRAGKYERGRGRLRSWLFGIARIEARRAARSRRARREQRESDRTAAGLLREAADARLDETSTHDVEHERARLQLALARVREEVSERTFQSYWMVAYEGRRASDVAATLGVPLTVVYNATSRVRARVKELALRSTDA